MKHRRDVFVFKWRKTLRINLCLYMSPLWVLKLHLREQGCSEVLHESAASAPKHTQNTANVILFPSLPPLFSPQWFFIFLLPWVDSFSILLVGKLGHRHFLALPVMEGLQERVFNPHFSLGDLPIWFSFTLLLSRRSKAIRTSLVSLAPLLFYPEVDQAAPLSPCVLHRAQPGPDIHFVHASPHVSNQPKAPWCRGQKERKQDWSGSQWGLRLPMHPH